MELPPVRLHELRAAFDLSQRAAARAYKAYRAAPPQPAPPPAASAEAAQGGATAGSGGLQLTVSKGRAWDLAVADQNRLVVCLAGQQWATAPVDSYCPRWDEHILIPLGTAGLPARVRVEVHGTSGCIGWAEAEVRVQVLRPRGITHHLALRIPPGAVLPLMSPSGGLGSLRFTVTASRSAEGGPALPADEGLLRVRRGEMLAADWTRAHLAAMRQHGPALGCIAAGCGEIAAAAAASRDEQMVSAPPRPLEGLPIGVSDRIAVGGVRTQVAGWEHVPVRSAPILRKAVSLGAVVLAKLRSYLEPPARGGGRWAGPLLPHNVLLPAGAGCSGCAVAVAAGLVPCALAVDAQGGARLPAALCGVACLKPLRGRYGEQALHGVVPRSRAGDCVCVVGRSVRACAAVDAALAGSDLPAAAAVRGLRLGVAAHRVEALSPAAARSWQHCCTAMRAAGATLVPLELAATLDALPRPAAVAARAQAEAEADRNAYAAEIGAVLGALGPDVAAPPEPGYFVVWINKLGAAPEGTRRESHEAAAALYADRCATACAATALMTDGGSVISLQGADTACAEMRVWWRNRGAQLRRMAAHQRRAREAESLDGERRRASQCLTQAMEAAGVAALVSPALPATAAEAEGHGAAGAALPGGVTALGVFCAEFSALLSVPSVIVPAGGCERSGLPFCLLLEGAPAGRGGNSEAALLSAALALDRLFPPPPAPPPPGAPPPSGSGPQAAGAPRPPPPRIDEPCPRQPAPPALGPRLGAAPAPPPRRPRGLPRLASPPSPPNSAPAPP
eukprot:TRINITY_DN16991_c0_g1_i1.p1 TRINITY_DN16991_c0_g1~~TRINITY_DN16991_c0_g1_i1.p1  ORF type:complete len:791 (+),score=203.99 TRINITY_DN16991_c0_g1_i1:71-2443(+)